MYGSKYVHAPVLCWGNIVSSYEIDTIPRFYKE